MGFVYLFISQMAFRIYVMWFRKLGIRFHIIFYCKDHKSISHKNWYRDINRSFRTLPRQQWMHMMFVLKCNIFQIYAFNFLSAFAEESSQDMLADHMCPQWKKPKTNTFCVQEHVMLNGLTRIHTHTKGQDYTVQSSLPSLQIHAFNRHSHVLTVKEKP